MLVDSLVRLRRKSGRPVARNPAREPHQLHRLGRQRASGFRQLDRRAQGGRADHQPVAADSWPRHHGPGRADLRALPVFSFLLE